MPSTSVTSSILVVADQEGRAAHAGDRGRGFDLVLRPGLLVVLLTAARTLPPRKRITELKRTLLGLEHLRVDDDAGVLGQVEDRVVLEDDPQAAVRGAQFVAELDVHARLGGREHPGAADVDDPLDRGDVADGANGGGGVRPTQGDQSRWPDRGAK
jgi:hypothetical protein